ncbi:MAG: hypothetical protein EB121_03520 [Alphaproteobacteria bacterium]|nr:hypothetical protein [Alphaproteobacteria bacterium]
MPTQIQLRRGTAAQWTSANPTLAQGEVGVETDTSKFKVGTGSTAWTSLAYAGVTGAASSTDGALVAFDGTTGKVIKANGTVTAAQGGTGQTSFTNGQLLIGNASGGLSKATLTAGSNVTITNGDGAITIAAAGGGGGGSPGGSTTQVQYNNAGAFGGISQFTTDGTRVTASTTIGVGGATPSTSGNGITFPATASLSTNPNTLDDYEEGTWTPTDQSGAGLTFTTFSSCRYIKIGQMVTIVGIIIYPTTSSGSNASIGGLPYVAGAGTLCGVTPGIITNGTTTYINLNIVDSPNPNTLLRIFNINNVSLTNVQLSGAGFYFSLTYFSTSTT